MCEKVKKKNSFLALSVSIFLLHLSGDGGNISRHGRLCARDLCEDASKIFIVKSSGLLPTNSQSLIDFILLQLIDLGYSECSENGEIGNGHKGHNCCNLTSHKEATGGDEREDGISTADSTVCCGEAGINKGSELICVPTELGLRDAFSERPRKGGRWTFSNATDKIPKQHAENDGRDGECCHRQEAVLAILEE